MSTLKEKFINSLVLTLNQKTVMAKIAAAPTEKVAAEDISRGANLVSARDMLVRMGLITFKDATSATLTDKGRQIAQDENIMDASGGLTDKGRKLVGGGGPETTPTESFSLIKKLSLYEGVMKDLSITVDDFIEHVGHDQQGFGRAMNDGDELAIEQMMNQSIKDFNKEQKFSDTQIVRSALERLFPPTRH